MRQGIDKWTVALGSVLVLSALLACKKKDEPAPAASAIPAVSIAPLPPDAGAPALGDVKRFPDKERAATGAVKVTVDNALVYDQPDEKTPSVASLSKDIFVERIATLGTDWLLVSFPSGVGKLSPGWIETKSVGAQVTTVTHAVVAAQSATATPAPSASAPVATTTSTAAIAPPKATTTTTAVAAPPATVAPKPRPQLLAPPKH